RSADKRVAGDRPLQGVDRHPRVLADRGQQDADRGGVGVDDEGRETRGGQHTPRASCPRCRHEASAAAYRWRNKASTSAMLAISLGSTLSLGAWIRHWGSSTPRSMISAFGKVSAKTLHSGMDPPWPWSIGSAPHAWRMVPGIFVSAGPAHITAQAP